MTLKLPHNLILDGAMGTELQRRGISTGLPLWSATALIEAPDVVSAIHRDYIKSGAQVITTNTFRTTTRTFRRAELTDRATELTDLACRLARREAALAPHKVYVGGCLASLEDCYRPDLTPSDQELIAEHTKIAADLASGGVDFIFAETHNSLRELRAVLHAISLTKLPFAISFVANEAGDLLSGEPIEEAIHESLRFNPLFVGTNCAPLGRIERSLDRILTVAGETPVAIYANGDGEPDDAEGWKFSLATGVPKYVAAATQWRKKGARFIGGCCGTTPEYIAGL
jgi:homocysteine S-methyltransferase